jgi:diguanylate cyclase (GGDEF)-like protein
MATHDSLTGVFNRREFEKKLKTALKNATENGAALTVLYLDLDQFKVVNDTCGHKAGDLLINQLSRKLNKLVSAKGTLARLGGDEFGILLQNDNAQMAYLLANKILNAVAEFRFVWEDHIFTLGISIGQASWSEGVVSPEHLLSMADSACYMAKERGRNQVHTYSEDDEHVQRYESQLSWLSQINQAIDNHQFELYYQHYQSLTQHNTDHHYEILLRLKDAGGKLISPADFLPSAERYNLTAKIDKWVIENFFQWLALHPEHIQHLDQANINLSGHSLADKELKLFVLNAFEKHKIPYKKICFEITESMAILKMEETLEFIHTFQNLGCKFALDDFGSGFSSYNHLKNLPVQQLKIDGSFVKDILIDPIDLAMVKSIKDVAKAMGMETIAEFVESTDIMVELGKMGVDYAQGYGIAKPAPLTNFMPLNH